MYQWKYFACIFFGPCVSISSSAAWECCLASSRVVETKGVDGGCEVLRTTPGAQARCRNSQSSKLLLLSALVFLGKHVVVVVVMVVMVVVVLRIELGPHTCQTKPSMSLRHTQIGK